MLPVAAKNVPASSRITGFAPAQASTPAPSSGETRRRPCDAICSAEFASASRSPGTSTGSSAVCALAIRLLAAP